MRTATNLQKILYVARNEVFSRSFEKQTARTTYLGCRITWKDQENTPQISSPAHKNSWTNTEDLWSFPGGKFCTHSLPSSEFSAEFMVSTKKGQIVFTFHTYKNTSAGILLWWHLANYAKQLFKKINEDWRGRNTSCCSITLSISKALMCCFFPWSCKKRHPLV